MNRIILYVWNDGMSTFVPYRKSYKKSRYKNYMSRHHSFYKEQRERKKKK